MESIVVSKNKKRKREWSDWSNIILNVEERCPG